MRIATVGKGGAGKTTIAGTLARILAKKENKTLAIDGDPNPNLALTLGISRDQANNINFIPHTKNNTTWQKMHIGEKVNIEIDILARYVDRILGSERKKI